MRKPNKTWIQTDLVELRRWYDKRRAIDTRRDKDLAPHKTVYDAAAEPILALHAGKVAPVDKAMAEITKRIEAELLLGKTGEGQFSLPQVMANGVTASIGQSGVRSIEPRALFNAVPESGRDGKFWECLATLIGKVDTNYGERFKALIVPVYSKARLIITYGEKS